MANLDTLPAFPVAPAQLAVDEEITLSRWRPVDQTVLYELIASNRDHLAPWFPWAADFTPGDAADTVEAACEATRAGLEAPYLIRCEGEPAGVIKLYRYDAPQDNAAAVDCWLDQTYEGQGIARRSLRALAGYALQGWQVDTIEARIDPQNRRSQALARAGGAVFDAVVSTGGSSAMQVWSLQS